MFSVCLHDHIDCCPRWLLLSVHISRDHRLPVRGCYSMRPANCGFIVWIKYHRSNSIHVWLTHLWSCQIDLMNTSLFPWDSACQHPSTNVLVHSTEYPLWSSKLLPRSRKHTHTQSQSRKWCEEERDRRLSWIWVSCLLVNTKRAMITPFCGVWSPQSGGVIANSLTWWYLIPINIDTICTRPNVSMLNRVCDPKIKATDLRPWSGKFNPQKGIPMQINYWSNSETVKMPTYHLIE